MDFLIRVIAKKQEELSIKLKETLQLSELEEQEIEKIEDIIKEYIAKARVKAFMNGRKAAVQECKSLIDQRLIQEEKDLFRSLNDD